MLKSNWNIHVDGRCTAASDIISKFWNSRGITNPAQFLNPTGNMIHPQYLGNIDKAAKIFNQGIDDGKKFLIYADVDVDGCTAAAQVYHYLIACSAKTECYINEKKEHGITDKFFDCGIDYDILIVVDSINDSMDKYNRILDSGKQLIVLDHHIPSDEVKAEADTINLISSAVNYPNPHLSGSGVVWKFLNYVDYLNHTDHAEELLDLAATGLIADVCSVGPDSMENREICHYGFRNLKNIGLRAAVGQAELTSELISFSIAPLVNAANRMNENKLALELFLVNNTSDAKKIVKELTKLKDKQKKMIAELLPKIKDQVSAQTTERCYYFIIDDSYGTLGGLLATKLSDEYKRPCIVVHEGNDNYAGSMRAVGVDNFSKIVNDSGFGECMGHENSAGIVIPKANLDALKSYVEAELKDLTIQVSKDVDIRLDRVQITPFLLDRLAEINRITGANFSTVTVAIDNVQNYTVKQMSQGKHLCVEVPDMKFLYWNFTDWENIAENGVMSAVGVVSLSFFAGRKTVQMLMQDYNFQEEPTYTSLW